MRTRRCLVSTTTSENPQSLSIASLAVFGALGGLTASIVSLVGADMGYLAEVVRESTWGLIVGYTIRLVILAAFGSVLALANRQLIRSVVLAFQVGISGPALITTTLTGISGNV